jgi:hypothetical protein
MDLGIKGICDKCNKNEGILRSCPYSEQVYEIINLEFLCDECYEDAIWSI